jgi:hypothetical protein
VVSIVVSDNGTGGATATPGSGLAGIARRLAAFEGQVDADSPAGGPTRVSQLDGAVRVVIAEDLFLLRDGIVRLLEAHGHSVIAAVETGPAALDALLGLRPDVAILDVRLPPTFTDEGLQAALATAGRSPACLC